MFTQKDLNEKLKFWKGILGLKRWRVKIKYGEAESDCVAQVNYKKYKKSAWIILSNDARDADVVADYCDWLILHELTHIVFARYRLSNHVNEDTGFQNLEEIVCDSVASALCRAYELPILEDHPKR